MKLLLTLFFALMGLHATAQESGAWFRYYSDGRAVVKRDSLYGFIDRSGNEVIPCQYRKAYNFNDGIAMVRRGYEVFAIDTMGNRLDLRVKIPQFYNEDFENFVYWVWRRIPFASTTERHRLADQTVNARITIGKDGQIIACESLSPVDSIAFAKVRDVVMSSPHWSPGQIDGKPVEISYLLPVPFAKLRGIECYPVDAQGRRLHADFVYPLFEGEPALAFASWFFRNIRYKKGEYQQAAPGTVRTAFTVAADGSLRDIEILDAHNEMCRLKTLVTLKKSPKWTPGTIDGKAIPVRYEYSFTFRYR